MTRFRTLALALVAACAALLALAGAASAHVTVHSTDATRGGYAALTFQVPTESATASTTKLQVQLPTNTPIASVLVQPHVGWSFHVTTSKLTEPVKTRDGDTLTEAPSQITWTADSAASAIKPGEFDQFLVSAGPLPDVASLRFPAIQTYSDGSVVKWIETAAPGSTVTPDHPAPVLTLAPAAGTQDPSGTVPSGQAAASNSSSSNTSSDNTGPTVLAVVALVVAAAALGLAVVTRARGGRS